MSDNSCKFQAKLYLIRDGGDDIIENLKVFCPELDPVVGLRFNCGDDWVQSYLEESQRELREMLGLPKDGNSYHVLFSGSIRGWGPDYNGEYDEDMDIDDKVQSVVLPQEWLDTYWKLQEQRAEDIRIDRARLG